jgi:hypothetical protein
MKKLFALAALLFLLSKADAQTLRIEAENWNAMSGVLTQNSSDAGGGLDVGWIDNGDWMDYSYTAPTAGTYTVRFRLATQNSFAQFQVKNSTGQVLATVNVPTTGSYQTWQTTSTTLTLPAGAQVIRLQSSAAAGWNINWWELDPPAGGTNQPPTVNAGVDQVLTLPANSVQLSGSAADPDAGGSVASINWSRVSGPTTYTFSSSGILNPSVTGLVQGVYVFRLTATDNVGGSSSDDLTVTVNAAPVSGGWSLTGNAVTAGQSIGTTNSVDLLFKAGNHSWARLTTTGSFEANKIKVRADGWADFVFDPSYRLRPLTEVQQFIKKHGHLPDVPSAKQVMADGINVGDNQAVLLRKIEELTLYLIEQNKKLEQQAVEIRQLKKQVLKKAK